MGGSQAWRRKAMISAAVVLGLAVAGGGIAYGTGAYDEWQDGRSLSSACDGLLDGEQAKDLLGAERLRGKEAGWNGCTAFEPGRGKASMVVRVQQGSDSARMLSQLARIETHWSGQLVGPVGGGWPAVISPRGYLAYAGAYLPCGKGPGDDLIVSIAAHRDASVPSFDDRTQQTRLARIVTQTLTKAAEKQGCELPDGADVSQAPDGTFKTLKRAAETKGTCRGTGSAGYEAAADGAAPIEDCLLADAQGKKLFRLAAYYGPYVKSARLETLRGKTYLGRSGGSQGVYWTTVSCPSGDALYAIEPLDDGERFATADPELERRALKVFAAGSAQRHGCGAVADAPRKAGGGE
ncbi:hypothetical protein OG883_26870 [Streptomyces sp. NBC_01142]|uniref:hypothetical protein n=1 Tax=Streptomyces sp. NBC_01142 TaxID=2975865 RepID=UPI0022571C71|nr:hypothetical protein [Streptomyces sp. NBC_01142]MCX4823437.1 hypothetical protein [Streptomyces sp. NBC_01142]